MADISKLTLTVKKEDGTTVTTTYDIKDEIAREQLSAIPDGTYPDMTVGGVMSSDGSTDSTPYLYRVSGGGVEVGNIEVEKIVGGTIAWNQLCKPLVTGNWAVIGAGATLTFADGIATFTAVSTFQRFLFTPSSVITGHKYLLAIDLKAYANANINYAIGSQTTFGSQGATLRCQPTDSNWHSYASIKSFTSGTDDKILIQNSSDTTNTIYVKNAVIFDLTQMFGSNIADMIYNMEQSSTGAGVAFFRKLFPNAYYPYNTGELMHVSGVSEHVMRGKNLNPNEGVNYTINNSQRFFMKAGNYVFSTDNGAVIAGKNAVYIQLQNEDGTVITKGGITSTNMQPNGTETYYFGGQFNSECAFTLNYDAYMLIGFNNQKPTNFNALQIELGTRATAYKPYREPYTYPLDSSLTLRGIPKLSNGLYFDGDTYEADGTVTRKYGVVDLGTLNWNYEQGGSYTRFYNTAMQSLVAKPASDYVAANIICAKFPTTSVSRIYGSFDDKVVAVGTSGTISIRDTSAGTNPSVFKTAMSGVYLIYELATPTTESAEPYESIQKVSKYGTEEYVSTGIVPVGHVTKYPTDIVSKVNGLPSDFSTLIAPTETDFKATRAYSVNQFIIVSNQLYRVTSAIANGATITVGTNVVATTIADILTSLLNA